MVLYEIEIQVFNFHRLNASSIPSCYIFKYMQYYTRNTFLSDVCMCANNLRFKNINKPKTKISLLFITTQTVRTYSLLCNSKRLNKG